MEPIHAILTKAAGYILKGAVSNKVTEKASEEVLGGFWAWIRPYLLEDIPEIENPKDIAATEQKVLDKLVDLIEKDENFFENLLEKLEVLKKAGIKEKNIVRKDIKRVKKIRIGDKVYLADEPYHRKNIVEGSVEDADEFILGDGH